MKIELRNIRLNEDMNFDSFFFTAQLYVERKKVATVVDDGMGSGYRYENIEPENRLLFHNAEQYVKSLASSAKSNDPLSVHNKFDDFISQLLCDHIDRLDKRELVAIIRKGIAYGDGLTGYRFVKFFNPVADLLKTSQGISTIEWALRQKVLPKIKPGEKILNRNIPEDIIKRVGFSEDQYTIPDNQQKAPEKIANKSRKGKGL